LSRRRFSAGRTAQPRASAAHTQRQPDALDALVRSLGWFSLAVGAAELLLPRALNRAIGTGIHPTVTRLCGLRELAAGAGLLTQGNPTPWLWSRVAGDVMDLALLAAAAPMSRGDGRLRLAVATLAVAGVTAADVLVARQSLRQPRSAPGILRRDGSIRVEETLAVNRSREDCYRMWRDLESLPRFMSHLKSVQVIDDRRSHWVAGGPADSAVEWDAEITRDEPNALLSWRSLPDSEVRHAGSVRFLAAPPGRGTLVSVTMQYEPPAGSLGVTFARLFGEAPEQQVRDDLRQFKQLLEAGEIATIEGQSHGPRPAWYRIARGSQR
jgi:uncharacterized membrane protein